ncbi:MAG: ABC transporter permease subunit [Bacteroidetes bacterium]|nr:ABC transporter permease subunit [Bacteroidota bacterium]
MNRILFFMEMRRNARSLLLWSLVISALVFFTMSFFHTVMQYQQQIAGMVQLIPAVAMKMRGFSNINDIFSVMGFYAANNIIYMMLVGSIFAIVLSSNILLKEEFGKTAEYLMSRPISRNEIFLTKLTLAFLNIFILNLIVTLVGFVAIRVYKEGSFNIDPFLVISLYTLLLNLLFGALGFFISVVMKRARPVTFFCVGLALVLYFLYSISKMTGVDGTFGYLSPFKWVNVEVLSPSYTFEMWRIGLFAGIAGLLISVSNFIYRKKDILT